MTQGRDHRNGSGFGPLRPRSGKGLRGLSALEVEAEATLKVALTLRWGAQTPGSDVARVGQVEIEGSLREALRGARCLDVAVEDARERDRTMTNGGRTCATVSATRIGLRLHGVRRCGAVRLGIREDR